MGVSKLESLTYKMNNLNIKVIDDAVYHSELKQWELLGRDISKWKYYKRYGDQVMLYSEPYLSGKTLKELKIQDRKNKDLLGQTLKSKLKRWLDSFWFRFGW